MVTIFMNSGSSKTSESHRLLLNSSNKIDLRRIDLLLYQIFAYIIHGKKCKKVIQKQ